MKRYLIALCLFLQLSVASAQIKGVMEDKRGVMPGIGKLDNQKLIEMLSDALDQYPNQPAQYNNRALAKYNLEAYDSALVDLNKAIELSPKYAEAYYNRGLVHMKLKNYAGAIEDFGVVTALNEKDQNAFYNSSVAYYLSGKKEEAISELDKALKLLPDFDKARCNMGVLQLEKGNFEAAIEQLTLAIRLNAEDGDYFNNRGEAYRLSGDTHDACKDFKAGARLGNMVAFEAVKSCE